MNFNMCDNKPFFYVPVFAVRRSWRQSSQGQFPPKCIWVADRDTPEPTPEVKTTCFYLKKAAARLHADPQDVWRNFCKYAQDVKCRMTYGHLVKYLQDKAEADVHAIEKALVRSAVSVNALRRSWRQARQGQLPPKRAADGETTEMKALSFCLRKAAARIHARPEDVWRNFCKYSRDVNCHTTYGHLVKYLRKQAETDLHTVEMAFVSPVVPNRSFVPFNSDEYKHVDSMHVYGGQVYYHNDASLARYFGPVPRPPHSEFLRVKREAEEVFEARMKVS